MAHNDAIDGEESAACRRTKDVLTGPMLFSLHLGEIHKRYLF
jgi:hypothetical protein